MDGISIFTILLAVLFPFVAMKLEKQPKMPSFFSAVVICYAIGIILANTIPQFIDAKLAEQLAGGSMLIALPLLLFGSKIRENWRLAGPGMFAYLLCVVAGLMATILTAWYFQDTEPQGWKAAGMLTGLYTGGTPNMLAIGVAVDAPSDFIVLLQSADIVGGGVYLLLLMTVIHPLLGRFLPAFKTNKKESKESEKQEGKSAGIIPLLLSLGIGATAAGLTFLLTGSLANNTLLILLLTTLSLGFSLIPRVGNMSNAFNQGEYFLLIFCVAIGLMANFSSMLQKGLPLLAFLLIAKFGLILLHWLFAWLFKIDRDTVMISSVAALYGPVFIPQITSSIKNKRLLAPGIALSLLGFAIGNYLGIMVAYTTRWLFW